MSNVTEFRQRVFAALRQVPVGRVTTYKYLGDQVGCRCYQAIGQALRHNPFAPVVPCHRVIASDLTIGGFGGHRSGEAIERKLGLLTKEGVVFRAGRLADPSRVFRFADDAGPGS